MKKLVFFTNSYPYTYTSNWKGAELRVLRKYFDDIVVAPLAGKAELVASDFPAGIRVLPPVVQPQGWVYSKISAARLLNGRFLQHLSTLKGGTSGDWREKATKWVIAGLNVESILTNKIFCREIAPELNGSCLYFY